MHASCAGLKGWVRSRSARRPFFLDEESERASRPRGCPTPGVGGASFLAFALQSANETRSRSLYTFLIVWNRQLPVQCSVPGGLSFTVVVLLPSPSPSLLPFSHPPPPSSSVCGTRRHGVHGAPHLKTQSQFRYNDFYSLCFLCFRTRLGAEFPCKSPMQGDGAKVGRSIFAGRWRGTLRCMIVLLLCLLLKPTGVACTVRCALCVVCWALCVVLFLTTPVHTIRAQLGAGENSDVDSYEFTPLAILFCL